MKINHWPHRAALFLLTGILAFQPMLALAQNTTAPDAGNPQETAIPADEGAWDIIGESPLPQASAAAGEIKYIATALNPIKVRRTPDKDSTSGDSVPKGSFVYILDLGDEWAKIRTKYLDGYVMVKYLENVRDYDGAMGIAGAGAATEPTSSPAQTSAVPFGGKDSFVNGYTAMTVKVAVLYAEPDERSRSIGSIRTYKNVIVSVVNGDWCYVKYDDAYGYVRCDSLFMWDRIDPYIGEIPGLVHWPVLAFVNHTTNISSMEDHSFLAAISPGGAVCVGNIDNQGRYPLPYWRTTGYILPEDVAYTIPVVPYEQSKPGDLISVMTTYYAVGIHTVNYQGRNWNIRLSSSLITGTVLQPGEDYDMNSTIGPYLKSTGYHKAPIMSPDALWGYGGGTCQVNTTFYITTIQLPLLVSHRRVHAKIGIYYAPKGFDAAVGGGEINLKMTNTLPFPIRYQFFISDGVLTCCIFRAE